MSDETPKTEQKTRVVKYTCPRCKERLEYAFRSWDVQPLRRRGTLREGDRGIMRVRVFIPPHAHSQTGRTCPASNRRHTLTSRGV